MKKFLLTPLTRKRSEGDILLFGLITTDLSDEILLLCLLSTTCMYCDTKGDVLEYAGWGFNN